MRYFLFFSIERQFPLFPLQMKTFFHACLYMIWKDVKVKKMFLMLVCNKNKSGVFTRSAESTNFPVQSGGGGVWFLLKGSASLEVETIDGSKEWPRFSIVKEAIAKTRFLLWREGGDWLLLPNTFPTGWSKLKNFGWRFRFEIAHVDSEKFWELVSVDKLKHFSSASCS